MARVNSPPREDDRTEGRANALKYRSDAHGKSWRTCIPLVSAILYSVILIMTLFTKVDSLKRNAKHCIHAQCVYIYGTNCTRG